MTEKPSLLLGPVTDSDRRRWQLAGADALVAILTLAAKHGMPPLSWSVGEGSAGICGRVSSHRRDAAQMREVFERWAKLLGLARRDEFTNGAGTTLLRAGDDHWTSKDGRYRARVYVMADVYQDEAEGMARSAPEEEK
jgi:hypothetical protein